MSGSYFAVASIYANAVMKLGLSKEKLERVVFEMLEIAKHDVSVLKFESFVSMPLSEETKNILKIVFSQKKAKSLPFIALLLKMAFAESMGVVFVSVKSAKTVAESEKNEIKKELETFLKKEIVLETSIDESLIEGFSLSFGSYLLDFSKKAKISKIKACILK